MPSDDKSSSEVKDDIFLTGAGEMGALVRAIDWRQTPLGALSEWPQSLRTTMSICLNSKFPIAVYWGPEFLMLYNQSLVPMVGAKKHPQALGQPASVVLAAPQVLPSFMANGGMVTTAPATSMDMHNTAMPKSAAVP